MLNGQIWYNTCPLDIFKEKDMSIFKAYDIRGIHGQDLVPDDFYKIARA